MSVLDRMISKKLSPERRLSPPDKLPRLTPKEDASPESPDGIPEDLASMIKLTFAVYLFSWTNAKTKPVNKATKMTKLFNFQLRV